MKMPGGVRLLMAAGIGLPLSALLLLAATGVGGSGRAGGGLADASPILTRDSLERLYWMQGPTSGDVANGMVVDADGTLFLVGFHGGLDFENDGEVDLPADGIDPFFLKFSAQGALSWVRSPTAPGFQTSDRIALDRAGGLYAIGQFQETMDFGDGIVVRGAGPTSGYVVRYDGEGEVVWTRRIGGRGRTLLRDVASDAAGNVYVIGYGELAFTIEGHADRITPRGETALFLFSYDREGRSRWVRTLEGPGAGLSFLNISPGGELVLSGWFGEAGVDFDGDGGPEVAGRSGRHGFLARVDPRSGDFRDAWRIVGPAGDAERGVGVGHVNFMADGDLAVGVGVAAWADLDGDGESDVEAREGDSPTGYLVRFGPNREVRWARTHTIDAVWDVATDGERLLLAGTYEGERDLNEDGVLDERDGIGYRLDENRASELVVQVLSGDGRVEAVVLAPGLGNDSARGAVFVPGTRSFYVTGSIQLTADFSGDRSDDEGYVECDALGDLFLARYALVEEPCRVSLTATGRRGERLLLADLTWSGAPSRTVDIYRDGELVATTENDGAFTDRIPRGVPGPYEYRIIPTGMAHCGSNTVRVGF